MPTNFFFFFNLLIGDKGFQALIEPLEELTDANQ